MPFYDRLCPEMKTLWVKEIGENKNKTGYTVSAPEILPINTLMSEKEERTAMFSEAKYATVWIYDIIKKFAEVHIKFPKILI